MYFNHNLDESKSIRILPKYSNPHPSSCIFYFNRQKIEKIDKKYLCTILLEGKPVVWSVSPATFDLIYKRIEEANKRVKMTWWQNIWFKFMTLVSKIPFLKFLKPKPKLNDCYSMELFKTNEYKYDIRILK